MPATNVQLIVNHVRPSVARHTPAPRYTYTAQADVYNALNLRPVIIENTTFGPTLDLPQTVLQGRMWRLVTQWKW